MIAKTRFVRKKSRGMLQSIFLSLLFLVIFFGVLTYFIFQNVKLSVKRVELTEYFGNLQAQAQELAEKKAELEAGIAESKTELYKEKILREQGLYKKRGEEVVTILPPEEHTTQEQVEQEGKTKKWWNPLSW